jgi:hypothetical protein
MVDVEKYCKLLKSLRKLGKTPNNTWIKKMCGFGHKPRHLKEYRH